jgi:uncharacterized protein YdcH (DUF465 family)
MYGEKHDLLHEFPEHRDRIHDLKKNDHHFTRLYNEYHNIDQEIHRIEQGIETPADDYTEQLKKQRLFLKDQLLAIITA